MSDRPIRVALCEDSVLLREGLTRLLEEAGHTVVGAWGDAEDIVARVEESGADVVIMDVRLPPRFHDDGIVAARAIRAALPDIAVLVLSQYVEQVYARELLSGGADSIGYLLKDRMTSLTELDEAIVRLHKGGTVLDPQVVAQMLAGRADPLAVLTPREREVLALMAEGLSNAAIATRLFVGVGAVEKHVNGIFAALGLTDGVGENRRVRAVVAWLGR